MPILQLLPARIESGKILWRDPLVISKVFSAYNGKNVLVTIQPERRRRSINQNAYYHAVVVKIISDELGHSEKETHEILAGMFLTLEHEVKLKSGKIFTVKTTHSTADLSTTEFEDYLRRIREWASIDLNLFIPLPNEIMVEYGNYGG
jgi:hypothetical protein